ncbi:hypothetical protein AXF42_Ash021667 [Apostasia shenzhenica]|uniref:Uncharacterized protein n=1 Tax=Apostasia shenzhenica TaxID=1088818 RepID=A0A2H9ZRU1_9ASPA|nr:hypothetical protein AXF42_Ash021667 [Apostasia shenzhenica]
MASNNCLLLSQLHGVVLLGLCATTATAPPPISGENNDWVSVTGQRAEIAVLVAVYLWNLYNSETTGTVIFLHTRWKVWEMVGPDGVTTIHAAFAVLRTFTRHPHIQWFASADIFMTMTDRNLPLGPQSIPRSAFYAYPLIVLGVRPHSGN